MRSAQGAALRSPCPLPSTWHPNPSWTGPAIQLPVQPGVCLPERTHGARQTGTNRSALSCHRPPRSNVRTRLVPRRDDHADETFRGGFSKWRGRSVEGKMGTLRSADDRVEVQETARRHRVGRQPAEDRFDGDISCLCHSPWHRVLGAARTGEVAGSDRADSDHRPRSRFGKSKPIVIQPKRNTQIPSWTDGVGPTRLVLHDPALDALATRVAWLDSERPFAYRTSCSRTGCSKDRNVIRFLHLPTAPSIALATARRQRVESGNETLAENSGLCFGSAPMFVVGRVAGLSDPGHGPRRAADPLVSRRRLDRSVDPPSSLAHSHHELLGVQRVER